MCIDETNDQSLCESADFEKFNDNFLSNLFLESSLIEKFNVLNDSEVSIILNTGESGVFKIRELNYKLEEYLGEKLRNKSFYSCENSHGNSEKSNYYCYTCGKNVCDECFGKNCEIHGHSIFNFDNNYKKYRIYGQVIEEKLKDRKNDDMKEFITTISEIFNNKNHYYHYSFFTIILGIYVYFVINKQSTTLNAL